MEQIKNQIKVTYDTDHQQPVVSSLQVAEDFKKQHKHVLVTIEKLIEGVAEKSADLFYKTSYEHEQNHQLYPMYLMNRDGFSLLVMSFNGKNALEWKLKYINAFNALEKEMSRLPVTPEEKIDLLLEVSKSQKEKVKQIDERVIDLEENQRLDAGQYSYIGKLISSRIREVKEVHKLELNKKQNGELFHGINKEIVEITGVRTRTALCQKDFNKVCQFISGWEPSKATMQIMEDIS